MSYQELNDLDDLFYELLELWYSTELSFTLEFETYSTNYLKFKKRYEDIKKEIQNGRN